MNTGELGEQVVAQWLQARGSKILHRRWRWKRGEIDLIAVDSETLLFIEVKTRNRRNWDTDGLLAITQQKQARIIRTAELFLVKHPQLAEYPCRFDVAIVRHQPLNQEIVEPPLDILTDLNTNERMLLLSYIPGAFDCF
jgi:putative endonuclease